MGWFTNAATANRLQNTRTIMDCAALLEANQTVLDQVTQFSDEQIGRGNRLSAQAFSLQGVNSNLGRQLQQAVRELDTFKREAEQSNSELDQNATHFLTLVQQFSVPRAARVINASGKQMTEAATEITAHSIANLITLAAQNQTKIAQNVDLIDRADESLNPGNSAHASLTLPNMEFRER